MYPKKTIGKNLSLQLKSLYGQKKKKHCLLASRKVINLYQKKTKQVSSTVSYSQLSTKQE